MLKAPITVIAVSETWLTELLNDVYSIPGYNFFAKSRTGKTGGGVGLSVNNSFDCKIYSDLCRMTEYLECIFLECCQAGTQSFIVGSVYRPPNSDLEKFNSDVLSILDYISGRNKLAIIAGDYNLNLLNSNNHPPTREFLNNFLSFNFLPTIKNPTRISDISATLIDNIFVSSVKCDYSSAIVYCDISDHLPTALHLTTNSSKTAKIERISKRFFDSRSIEDFKINLANTNWDEISEILISNADPNYAYERFSKTYTDIFNKHFPEKNINLSNRMTPRHDWMTKGLMRSCIKKSKLYRKFCNRRTQDNKKKYVRYRNKLKTLLRIAEKNYFSDKFKLMAGNIRETWKLLGSLLNKNQKNEISNLFVADGVEIVDRREIVDKFNNYFVSIGSRLASAIPDSVTSFKDYLKFSNSTIFAFYPTNSNEIIEIASKLKKQMEFGFG